MAIDTIKSTAVLDGAIATADIADDAVTGDKLANDVAIANDLTVDTDTLFADASADKVGINTTAMDASLEVNSASSKINTLTVKTAAGSGGVAGIGFMAGQTTAGREKAAIFFKETNGGPHYTGDIVFAVANSSGNANQVAASDEVCRITPNGLAIGGTGAVNTLDDYEEGTFTPTLTPGSGSYNGLTLTGFYRKIGSIVHVIIRLNITASGNAGGSATVGNLPFTSANISSGLRVTNKWRENAATGVCGQFNIDNGYASGFLQNDDGTNIAHTTGRQYMINAMYFSA